MSLASIVLPRAQMVGAGAGLAAAAEVGEFDVAVLAGGGDDCPSQAGHSFDVHAGELVRAHKPVGQVAHPHAGGRHTGSVTLARR
ncbi:hypothetical protein ETD83_02480 [Actinomadura soli]|uniref:Uncharacterized protein n=1 Tax=Actinomadura soli TaxID=2508997 RepID=A0A5C4JJ03_9ACTN|nr:hypothetical protein [Actinomadura soli]TMR06907.1 hypothetical protein ETD83_02480 [Actinomadura soli]